MNQLITIANIGIRQDNEGRFCLNDFHRAAGGLDKHKPAYWTRGDAFLDLVQEVQLERIDQGADLQLAPVASVHGGSNPGTYVIKELVYAYAMWISAKFHLQVIRAYDQLVVQPQVQAIRVPTTFREALLLAAEQQEKLEQAHAQIAMDAPKVRVYDTVVATFSAGLAGAP